MVSHPFVGCGRTRRRRVRRRGAMLVLMALLLVVFLAAVALSVDVAYMYLVKTELRAATDAAAKAAVTTLATTGDVTRARDAARQVAEANLVAGRPLLLQDQDIVFGQTELREDGSVVFLPGATPYGAARVYGLRRRGSPAGGVALFFGAVLGQPEVDASTTATATRQERDLCLVIDRSGSLAGPDFDKLRAAVAVFLDTLDQTEQGELVGLVSYSTSALAERGLTLDYDTLREAVGRMEAQGWTDIGAGLDAGRGVLQSGRSFQFAEKALVLVTDGRQLVDDDPTLGTMPEEAAVRARAQNIVIYAIAFGANADQARMQWIAESTGGTYHYAPDGTALEQAYRDIARTITTVLSH